MSEIKKIKIGNETYNIGVDGITINDLGLGFSLYNKTNSMTTVSFNFTGVNNNTIIIDPTKGRIIMDNKSIQLTTGTTTSPSFFNLSPYGPYITCNKTLYLKDLLSITSNGSIPAAIRTDYFDIEFLNNGLRLNFNDENSLTITRTESTSSSSTITTLPPTTTTLTTT